MSALLRRHLCQTLMAACWTATEPHAEPFLVMLQCMLYQVLTEPPRNEKATSFMLGGVLKAPHPYRSSPSNPALDRLQRCSLSAAIAARRLKNATPHAQALSPWKAALRCKLDQGQASTSICLSL